MNNKPSRGIIGLKKGNLKSVYAQRQSLYVKYADFIINIDGNLNENYIVSKIIEIIDL
ncbi:MAG: hypothetical protein Q7S74_05155 [Nanoarchaeota archaeon]|nr:hypothetical protein [Nanoarchaeota archaeon]